jgi:1-acyl-sn-glycerol-3-phosphate acyltransferase
MFPEGNIFREGYVQPLKPGMARIALQVEASKPGMDVAIVPISIRYSHPIPQWRCDVTVTIGTPIQVADYCTKSVKKSTQQLTHDLEAALRELNQDELLPNALPVLTSSETVLF